MRDPFIEELISAYLDDALSSDERLLVERRIAESSEYRQLLEELQRQNQLLSSLPALRLPSDFSKRLETRLEQSATKPKVAAAHDDDSKESSRKLTGRHRLTLNIVLGVASAIAAGLLIALIVRDNNGGPVEPGGPAIVKKAPVVPFEARLAAFQKRFNLLLIYDITVTPKGRQNRVLDSWFEKAGLNIERSIEIEDRLEKGILDSRFIGNDRIMTGGIAKDVAQDEVEMYFVRAKAGQIDDFGRLWNSVRGQPQDEIHLRMDMAIGTKELEIFLKINDAVDGEKALTEVSSPTWTSSGGYRLQFNNALYTGSRLKVRAALAQDEDKPETVSTQNGSNKVQFSDLQPLPRVQQNPWGSDQDTPSQVLIIVRNLKENEEFKAVGAPAN